MKRRTLHADRLVHINRCPGLVRDGVWKKKGRGIISVTHLSVPCTLSFCTSRSVRCPRNPLRAVPILSSVYCERADETAGADPANDDDFTSTNGSPIHLVLKDVARDDRAQVLDAGGRSAPPGSHRLRHLA